MEQSIYKDISLAEQGDEKIRWVSSHMPILASLEQRFLDEKPFSGMNISLSIHLEAKTAYLAKVFKSGGATVYVTGSNPMSTKDDVVAALVEAGIHVYAIHGVDETQYQNFVHHTLACKPHIVIDDGGDLVHELHAKYPEFAVNVIGACEETTTGVLRAEARERDGTLKFPVLSINGAQCKYLFDNRYGTGQSTFDGIMRTTNLVIAGKIIVIAGYGWCGKGCAMRADGMGSRVIITEVDPVKALEANMDGFEVMPMAQAAKIGDLFITATGGCDVLVTEHFEAMKDGAIVTNTGHFEKEINFDDLKALTTDIRDSRENIKSWRLKNGNSIHVLGEGALVNIACADGHPAEIMDMSFSLQAMGAEYLTQNKLQNKVYAMENEIDQKVASLKLDYLNISIDSLSKKQHDYLNGYEL